MGETQILPMQPAPSSTIGTTTTRTPRTVAADHASTGSSTATGASTKSKMGGAASSSPSSSNRCFVCFEPCISGSAANIHTRQDAWAMVCRLTVNGVRVGPGEPFTSVVRGTHYARPSAFDCTSSSCNASICCLCLCRRLREGIQYVAQHPLTCACGEVSLINETTVLFLTPEQEHQLYLRCDEWYCSDPLYCPVPTCSAYIPMLPCLLQFGRSKRASASSSEELPSRISCVKCDVPICTQCKGRADDEAHRGDDIFENGRPVQCTRPNIHHDKEVERLIHEKGYRKCPQCSTAVDRADSGCRQVQCFCGTVFCYSCTNPLDDCVCHPKIVSLRSRTVS